MNDWLGYVEELKEDLALNVAPFADLDPAYLVAITNWKIGRKLPKELREAIRDLGGSPDEWEFIGDAVIHTIITTLLTEQRLTVGQMTEVRSLVERNFNLQKVASQLGICSDLKNPQSKACADIFESLVGALYIHAFYAKHLRYEALDAIEDWLVLLVSNSW